jgi:AAA family ATP:ADP antiporter
MFLRLSGIGERMLGFAPALAPRRKPTVLIDVKRHERRALALSFVYFFCVLAAYYVIRPVRDQLGAVGGAQSLILFYAASFVATLAIMPLFGALVARLPRKRFVPIVYLFFIACLLAFVPLFRMQDVIGARVLGSVFFVWVSVFNLFVVSVFWSFMADIFSQQQARRMFSIIAIGGTTGAMLGPLLTSYLVSQIGVAQLLVVSAVMLSIALACVFGLIRWSREHPVTGAAGHEESVIGGSILAGAKQLLTSPFLRRMAILMLLADGVGTIIYGLIADYVKALELDNEARTAFYANLDLAVNTLTVVFQLSLTRWMMTRHGPAPTMMLWPAFNVVMLLAVAVFGGAWILAALVVTRAAAYGIFKPASDSLYTRVEREARYKGKNFIDTAVWRAGDLGVISLLNGLRMLGASVSGLAVLTAATSVAAGWFAWRAAHSEDLAPEAESSKPERH